MPAGERTIYDLWAEALATRDGRNGVDPAAFIATNRRAETALAGLLYGPYADFDYIVTALQGAGVDVVLHCNGDIAEMEAIAAVCPRLDEAALRRLRRAEKMRLVAGAGSFDRAAALARVDALLAGAVA